MATEIVIKCLNLRITAEENNLVFLEDVDDNSQHHTLALAIVGKVLSSRPYNFEALK